MILISITALFASAYVALIVYLIRGWRRLPEAHVPPGFVPDLHVCVIVPARNEAKHLNKCLESLVNQQYPKELLDIVVVDDHSDDDTLNIARQYEPRIRIIELKDHFASKNDIRSYKKLAIDTAIRLTHASVIVTLDADCTVEYEWLMTLIASLKRSGDVCVLGPVMIETKDDFFASIQALDMASLTGVAAATAGWDKPLVANGANMCYAKEAYLQVQGAEQQFTSGDDMFLLHKFVKHFPHKITFCKSPEALVLTQPTPDFISFFNQRLRWASKSGRFRDTRTLTILGFIYFFDVLLLVNAIAAVNSRLYFNVFLSQVLVKCFADIFFLKDVVTFYNRRNLLDLFLPAQLFRFVYVVITGVAAWFVPVKWKGRKVYR